MIKINNFETIINRINIKLITNHEKTNQTCIIERRTQDQENCQNVQHEELTIKQQIQFTLKQ